MFRWEDGRPLSPDWVQRRFRKLVTKSGLPPLSFSNMRDTHITLLYAAGVNPKVIQERVGHHDPGFTLRVYGSAGPTLQRAAIDNLAANR